MPLSHSPRRLYSLALTALLSLASASSSALAQPFTSPLPPPGEHPRIFFSPADLPAYRQRILTTDHGQVVQKLFADARRDLPALKKFADLDLSSPTPDQLTQYFKPDERRNITWGLLALDAVVREDADQKKLLAAVITNYARLILASKQLGATIENGRTGSELNRRQDVWKNPSFNVGVSWLFGAAGLPVAYDVLHPDMTPDQRDTVRRALAAATAGRIPWGSDFPKGRAISNHYGYHGELAVMLAAIEGEDGFDPATYARIRQVLLDYWEIGFTPEGACHEDSYGPNLGLRAGSLGLMTLARRGDDIFSTDKYRNFLRYLVYETQPFPSGTLVGGASGTGLEYPTSLIVARHTNPNDPHAAYLYHHFLKPDYSGGSRSQCQLDFALFGSDHAPAAADLTKLNLPLSTFSPRRGKLIARSDWTPDALALHFDARPDAFGFGHDTTDRGNIILSALGRSWNTRPQFRLTTKSTDFSLVHIDGLAQGYKAPSVRFLHHTDSPLATGGVADLKYAYDWQWTPPWPKKDQKFPAPWEPETTSPTALGWPANDIPDWLPTKLHDEPTIGYEGSYLHRKPYNPVQKAFRSTLLVRGPHPYILISDDIRKDGQPRTYTWLYQLDPDVLLDSPADTAAIPSTLPAATASDPKSVILKDPEGDQRLLIRVLNADGFDSIRLERYILGHDRTTKTDVPAARLVITANSPDPRFRILLYPHRAGQPLPTTAISPDGILSITLPAQSDQLTLTPDPTGRTRLTLTRGTQTHDNK